MTMKFIYSIILFCLFNASFAATPIDLSKQSSEYLNSRNLSKGQIDYRITRDQTDFNGTRHTRIQQIYQGIPVWDATGVIHQPKSHETQSQNGLVYESLSKDLPASLVNPLSNDNKVRALQLSKEHQHVSAVNHNTRDEQASPIIFVDDHHIAHYAYLTSFTYDDVKTGEYKQMSIIDASTHDIYRTWNAILSEFSPSYPTRVGGIGGNAKVGEQIYDGQAGHLPALMMDAMDIEVESSPGITSRYTLCMLVNDDIRVVDVTLDSKIVTSVCATNKNANDIHWLSINKGMSRWNSDEINGGYSPSLDAFYAATVIKQFYQDWYGIPALLDEYGIPMPFVMRVHYGRGLDNAFWNGHEMTFGDGGNYYYPLTSISVAAHEIAHGFTETHSNIDYSEVQMGALHESFSDMAAVTTENYMTGSNHWDIGREIKKDEGALRYLDNPRKDGKSIDNTSDITSMAVQEPHLMAGITNKAFYLIATTHGWTTRKAFNIMLQANMYYWTSSMKTLNEAACGVIQATKDYHYNVADVRIAFDKVGIDTDQCA